MSFKEKIQIKSVKTLCKRTPLGSTNGVPFYGSDRREEGVRPNLPVPIDYTVVSAVNQGRKDQIRTYARAYLPKSFFFLNNQSSMAKSFFDN